MIPVLTPAEMGEVDRAAPEPVEQLVRRAAGAVASAALELLGGAYGRRVVVVVGPGNNGWDGRVAAQLLERRGVRCTVLEVGSAPAVLPSSDLVIDAAFGTGFRGTYEFPDPDGAPVLAVDIPSGIAGLTGLASGRPAHAVRTVTFAALKLGHLLGDGPDHCGEVELVDIGLDVSAARTHLVADADVVEWVPPRERDAHKWHHAVWLVAGSPDMPGAARLAAAAAMRGGASYVRLSSPGVARPDAPIEAVTVPVPATGWAEQVLDGAGRFAVLAVGPGLGRSPEVSAEVRRLVAGTDRAMVLDGDALAALGRDAVAVLADRDAPTVLTPHDGEFAALTGAAPGEDRIESVRHLAAELGATVLSKGPCTVVADPSGECLLAHAGDERLATAGTGDVLTGLVAAHLALGVAPLRAAAAAAQVHGLASQLGPARGLVASDLVGLVPVVWDQLLGES
jgi:NAD(P)H-hydrate epimerase